MISKAKKEVLQELENAVMACAGQRWKTGKQYNRIISAIYTCLLKNVPKDLIALSIRGLPEVQLNHNEEIGDPAKHPMTYIRS